MALSNTPKTCVIFSETYLPLFGGAELYTYNLARQLVARGMRVTIRTYTTGDIPEKYQIDGCTVRPIRKFRKYEIFRLPSLCIDIYRTVRAHDLVLANYTYALSMFATIAASLAGKSVTVFAHGLGTIIDSTHPKIYYVYRYVSLSLATYVITTSEEIADIVRRFTPHVLVATAVDFKTIDRCIADESNQLPTQGTRKKILTVRRLVEKNGIQYLVEALPYLKEMRADFEYVVIGTGRLRSILEARVAELGLTNEVQFLGEMENEKVFTHIRSADVVVFPSSAEALSLAAIECMYLGTPIVVSGIGGLRELAGEESERGTMVDLFGRTESLYQPPEARELPPQVYKDFAHALSNVLDGGPVITEKAEAAKSYVAERYDWPTVTDEILTFIGESRMV